MGIKIEHTKTNKQTLLSIDVMHVITFLLLGSLFFINLVTITYELKFKRKMI